MFCLRARATLQSDNPGLLDQSSSSTLIEIWLKQHGERRQFHRYCLEPSIHISSVTVSLVIRATHTSSFKQPPGLFLTVIGVFAPPNQLRSLWWDRSNVLNPFWTPPSRFLLPTTTTKPNALIFVFQSGFLLSCLKRIISQSDNLRLSFAI